jgi:hypothetical protein
MDIKDIINDVLKDLSEEKEVKQEIGQINEKIRIDLIDLDEMRDQLKDDIEIRSRQIERQLKREFAGRMEIIEETHERIWQQIYDQLNIIDTKAKYIVNRRSGIVSKKMKVPKF